MKTRQDSMFLLATGLTENFYYFLVRRNSVSEIRLRQLSRLSVILALRFRSNRNGKYSQLLCYCYSSQSTNVLIVGIFCKYDTFFGLALLVEEVNNR